MDMNLSMPECVDIIDRISKLPDEILGKILNYLPTKEAVSTSILSKRWEHLSTLTSDLDFSDDWLQNNFDENDRIIRMRSFQKYVDRVIFYHGGSNIRKCNMSFCRKYVASSVHAWILAVITCNVQELFLKCFQRPSFYQLPRMLFSSNTLVDLTIVGTFFLDVRKYVCLPCLKLLRIRYVLFVDDDSVERLFSSCPVLEELIIQKLEGCLQITNISIPSLERLSICSVTIQTKINTPCLEYLQILYDEEEDEQTRYFVNFTSSLVDAELFGFDILLLNAISHVECLILTGNDECLEVIALDSTLPVFKKLKTLKLLLGWPFPNDWKVLPNLLDSSPNLQVLIFPQGLVHFTITFEDFNHFDWHRPEFVAECLSLHLKTIEIFEFVGFQEELDIVEYLLESAKVLETMIIHRFNLSNNPIMEMKADRTMSELFSLRRNSSTSEVMSFKRSSSICEIIFID